MPVTPHADSSVPMVAAEDDAAPLFLLNARGAGDAAAADLLDDAREGALGREAHRVDADLRREY